MPFDASLFRCPSSLLRRHRLPPTLPLLPFTAAVTGLACLAPAPTCCPAALPAALPTAPVVTLCLPRSWSQPGPPPEPALAPKQHFQPTLEPVWLQPKTLKKALPPLPPLVPPALASASPSLSQLFHLPRYPRQRLPIPQLNPAGAAARACARPGMPPSWPRAASGKQWSCHWSTATAALQVWQRRWHGYGG